ncbi:GRIP and coiled-coil domain-containing protein 1 [Boleophthalmus pectinirostris]|uniref:GRIP and coiled-coil domain-containing protein 1 n=1 Tax=Boleophthalmus pectinirostris TaxID=150288 RepID=UPI00242B24C4|nr:GRIP and coiled-coil domain-containing protein 1 [Boleophthalmus pectinirostris]XP_055017108.1 GRIP and coiled-coil domain-containing protein 1 [Boleophthalmus pectinirostris]
MEKFGMSFGGGPSRKDLLETVESQKKQLVQYQTRFRDVVRAYKSLLKEKEALEASLKVLSVSQDVDRTQQNLDIRTDLPDDRCSLHSEDSVDTAASMDIPVNITSNSAREDQSEEEQAEPPAEASGAESVVSSTSSSGEQQRATPPPGAEADRRVAQLKAQLSTLTSSLATVTQEKSRMESSFLADKRLLKQEVEDLQEQLQSLKKQHELEIQTLQEQLAESRARIITQQHERGLEQGDHAQQLRELQKLLQQERALRQDAELRRQDAELRLQEATAALLLTSQAIDRGAESEAHLNLLKEEKAELERRLQAAEEIQKKPDPRVEELQQELTELKKHHQQQMQSENKKVCEVEERERERAQAEEKRVAALEQQVSELSELLGSCEKAKQRDQQTIQRLRDRIFQLDTENKTLAIAASSRVPSDIFVDETQLDVTVLKEKLEKVKKLLVLAAQRNPEQTTNIEALMDTDLELCKEKASVQHYQQELRQVKEEFERYKVRAQVVLKNKNAKDGSQTKELEEVRDQLAELKEKYINLRIQSDEAEAKHHKELEERQQQSILQQHSHKQEVERLEALHRDNLLKLEAELHKQRERTMALLDEKDKELENLRAVALSYSLSPRGCHSSDGTGPVDNQDLTEGYSEEDIISQALLRATPNEPTILLYAEQLARKEVETGVLRRQKHQLEEDVHQLQAKLIANGERHDEEVADLRDQLEKLLRDQSREGANLEYLKNVIFKFLTLQDASGRQQTLGAILTILHFSPQEKQTVLRLQMGPWWSTTKR